MSTQRKALGRGLGALLGSAAKPEPNINDHNISLIDLDHIIPNPFQPRRAFSQDSIIELAESIQENRLLQPIVLRKVDGQFQIVNGERRYRAFLHLGKTNIPAVIQDLSDQEMLVCALIENIQREDLNPIEEALSLKQLGETFELTHEGLAEQLGKSRSYISNSLRLLKLPPFILEYVQSELLNPGGARALLAIKDEELLRKASSEIIVRGMNVRQIESYVKELLDEKGLGRQTKSKSKDSNITSELITRVQTAFQVPCQVKENSQGKVLLELSFDSTVELENYLDNFS